MKIIIIIGLIGICGCCPRYYAAEPAPAPAINLIFDYRYKGFSPQDTSFKITLISYVNNYSHAYYEFASKHKDSQRILYLFDPGQQKVLIESTTSNYRDSLTNLGYLTRETKNGNNRCSYSSYHNFDIHATYKGNVLSSGESSLLEINIIK